MRDGEVATPGLYTRISGSIPDLATNKKDMTKEDCLEETIHWLEATANKFYSPNEKGWNILLQARDKVQKLYDEEEIERIQKKKL